MSRSGDKIRRNRAAALWAAAIGLGFLAYASVALDERARRSAAGAQRVFPQFDTLARRIELVRITTKEGSYSIVRAEDNWVLADRASYPVERARVEELSQGLRTLAFYRPRTADPDKHARLNLADPKFGGDGVLVEILDDKERSLGVILVGEKNGRLYARRPGEAQTWLAAGALPALKDAASWLDLSPFRIDPSRFQSVSVAPASGQAYAFRRLGPDSSEFRLERPAKLSVSSRALELQIGALARFRPMDVARAGSLRTPAIATISAVTIENLRLNIALHEEADSYWAVLSAVADAPEAEAEVAAINARARAWAFRLGPYALEELAPTLDQLQRPGGR